MLHRLDKIFLEFLHHGAGGFHAVDQSNALSDKIADEIAPYIDAQMDQAALAMQKALGRSAA